MSAVLRGHDPDLGRDLAIKVLLECDEEMVRRFWHTDCYLGGYARDHVDRPLP
jgi:hypothetical protein